MIKLKIIPAAGLAASLTALLFTANAQEPVSKIYRATPVKINDLVHTKLDVKFDYKKRYLYGKEWVTIKPDTKPTDSLRLDAKGMDIKNISLVKDGKNIPLKYKYEDSLSLNIHLDKSYTPAEKYTIYIDYTSKPNELKTKGSAAINDAKGLYFINPDSTEKGKPVQIWTQGESESSSAWFPTIDKPNQKTTDEISMTVLSKYVTLSNGKLASQKDNHDGTRTDTWKMDLPHAPYLFMMAVGDFKIYHDKWHDIPVDYYLEPKYAPYAKDIFGMTPELIDFYSKTLGIDFPWNKYDQIVVRDYVSGAMENTTATLHADYVQATRRELLDANYSDGRSTIAHELFHQWFGDYVTTESWSNLTVNESFADFSETMWAEHKFSQDEGDAHFYDDMQTYLGNPDNYTKNLVRYNYNDKEDMFDAVTYKKGGCILNMMRTYLGNEVFYKGLNIYLKTNAFKTGNAELLRKALEQGSGKDLKWFFDEWYYGAGHPILTIDYKWNPAKKTETVYLKQTQSGKPFTMPMAVDIYAGGKKERHQIWMRNASDSVTFEVAAKPDLVNVDGDKKLVCQKTDNKTTDEYVFQYFNAPLYIDRLEALQAVVKLQKEQGPQKVMLAALNDKYYGLRVASVSAVDLSNDAIKTAALPVLKTLIQSDPNTEVRAAAIITLASLKNPADMNLFKEAIKSESYAVEGSALNAIGALSPTDAMQLAKSLEKDSEGDLAAGIINLYINNGGSAEWPYVYAHYNDLPIQTKAPLLSRYVALVGKVDQPEYAQQGIIVVKDLAIQYKAQGIAPRLIEMLNTIKGQRTAKGDTASAQAADDAIKAINEAK